jgi:3-hydroxyacyl-CoA dehydrogenase / enoyl-CoA hydratase / 3-hydroxybutyryl-CoA epimerase
LVAYRGAGTPVPEAGMLSLEIDTDGIALVTIDMPDRSMNVCDWAFADAIAALADRLRGDAQITGAILASGKRDFMAGADIAILADMTGTAVTPADAMRRVARIGNAFRRLEAIGKPVVAAASGTALGAGLELMLACHHRIGAQDDRARYGLPEVGLGILPGAGGTQRLPRLIGLEAALPLMLTGRPVPAPQALAYGLLDACVPPKDLLDAARAALKGGRVPALAPWDRPGFQPPGPAIDTPETHRLLAEAEAALAAAPGPSYPAPGVILACVRDGLGLPIDAALEVERQGFGQLATHPATPALIGLRFHAYQRAARAGLRRPSADATPARACREGLKSAAARLVAEGWPAARIQAAARAFDIGLPPLADTPAGDAPDHPRGALQPLARRLLLGGALAVVAAGPCDPDIADVTAVEAGGFPAWTGGPLALIDRDGATAVLAEAAAAGLQIPEALRCHAEAGTRFRAGEGAD